MAKSDRFRFLYYSSLSDEKLMELKPDVRLLFHYMTLVADDFGFVEDKWRQIQLELFREQGGKVDVEVGIETLVATGFLDRYMSYRNTTPARMLHIVKWMDYQKDTYQRPTFGDPSIIVAIGRDDTGKNIQHKREPYRRSVEALIIPTYVRVPVPINHYQRRTLAQRIGATPEMSAFVYCEVCQDPSTDGEVLFVPPFIGMDFDGTYVSRRLEIAPVDDPSIGAIVICRDCRFKELYPQLPPLGDHAAPRLRADVQASLLGAISDEQGCFLAPEPDDVPVATPVAAKSQVAEKKPRARDLEFEALAEVCGINFAKLSPPARGAMNKALKDLRSIPGGITADDIRDRAAEYKRMYPKTTLTPSALAKHWPQLEGNSGPTHQVGGRIADDYSEKL